MRFASPVLICSALVASLAVPALAHPPLAPTAPAQTPAAQTPPAQTPPAQTPPAQTPPAKPAGAPAVKPTPSAAATRQTLPPAVRLSLAVLVTAMDGKTLPDVKVKVIGAVDREAATDPSGNVTFTNLAPGPYRLRFEHEQFFTFEREFVLAAGRPMRVSVALNAAPPPPPPPPKVEPPPPAPAQTAAPPIDGNYPPTVVNVADWIDANFIGRSPSKRSGAGCSGATTSTMVQTNQTVTEHTHADADETLYVVAGEGVVRIGGRDFPLSASSFATIPRGAAHTITRKGSRPLMFVSTLSGAACAQTK